MGGGREPRELFTFLADARGLVKAAELESEVPPDAPTEVATV